MRLILCIWMILLISCNEIRWENPKTSIDIYQGIYRELIRAASQEDINEIEKLVKEKKINLNYSEQKYGVSLLNWCIFRDKPKAFEKLLSLGADPNWQDSIYKFPAPIIEAAKHSETSKFLTLSLKYGGQKNLLSVNLIPTEYQTPLLAAISSYRLENVKILFEEGADLNLTSDSSYTPLAESLVQGQIAITQFLLNNGANYKEMKYRTITGKSLSILDLLRANNFQQGTKEQKIKIEIIRFLKEKGFNEP